MKRLVLLPILAITSVAYSQASNVKYPGVTEKDFAPLEMNVKFKDSASLQRAMSMIPGRAVDSIPQIGVVKFKLNPGQSVLNVVNNMTKSGLVEFAEPNFRKQLLGSRTSMSTIAALTSLAKQATKVPNDPSYNLQYGPAQMKLPQAWNFSTGKASVVIAVIDTGINPTHEDLKNKIVAGQYDFSDNDADATDDTGSGHGSHCAGIAAAETNNGIGVAGASWKCSVLPLKIFPNAFDTTSAKAVTYAADKGVKVISMSYGSSFQSATEQAAMTYAWSKGVLPVAAAGNNNSNSKFYPAGLNNVLSVGATTSQDIKASFSNYGDWVSVAAPGENIYSTFLGATNAYVYESGTSMACPNVAGCAALLFAYSPIATNQIVLNALQKTCDASKDANGNSWVKNGRVNMYKAMLAMPSPDPFFNRPNSAGVFVGPSFTEGTTQSEVSASVAASWLGYADGTSFNIDSVFLKGTGQIASLTTSIPFAQTFSNVSGGTLRFVAKTSQPVSGFVLVFNPATGAYVNYGSVTLGKSAKTYDMLLPSNFGSLVQSGKVTFIFRTVAPSRLLIPSYTLSVDQVVITGYENTSN